jgi:beta-lactamase regulating signal transducer with metallopeptidase domain
MTATTQALSAALVHFVWQGAIVGSLLWLTLVALRNRTANARYIVSCVGLGVLTAMPLVTMAVLYATARPTVVPPVASRGTQPAVAAPSQTRVSLSVGSELQRINVFRVLQLWAVPVWSLGVVLFSARLIGGGAQALVLRRHGEPAEAAVITIVTAAASRMRIARPVRVLMSTLADSPDVIGWLRPVILLPPAILVGLTPQQLEAVLAHELAHIRRHDYLVNILQMVAETLFFYHPVVWWTSRQIRLEREHCCDDCAVACCGDALSYARALTTMEKRRMTMPSLAMGAGGASLLGRIQRLMGITTRECRPTSRWPGAVAISMVLIGVAWHVNGARAQSPAPRLAFEVASIKPNKAGPGERGLVFQPSGRFLATNVPVRSLIATAFGTPQPLPLFRIIGGANWLDSDGYDIEAKAANTFVPSQGAPGFSTNGRLMLRTLLADRFQLVVIVTNTVTYRASFGRG